MLNPIPPIDCAQARESASARLDGELSELDDARLDAHLRECPECTAYARRLATLAGALRDASLERPEIQIFVPRQRRVPGLTAAAAVALVAAAAVSSFALGRALNHGATTIAAAVSSPESSLRADSTQQHIVALLGRVQPRGAYHAGRDIFA